MTYLIFVNDYLLILFGQTFKGGDLNAIFKIEGTQTYVM